MALLCSVFPTAQRHFLYKTIFRRVSPRGLPFLMHIFLRQTLLSPPQRPRASTHQTGKGLNNPCFLESGEGAVLFKSFESFRRDVHDDSLIEFGYENAAALEISLAADLPGRVKLRRTGAVRVPPADLRAFAGDFAGSCHSRRMVA